MNNSYEEFLAKKRMVDPMTGMVGAIELPSVMKPHQHDITSWALRRGRAAIFAGTGLGKTLMELVWAHRVADYTGKPVLAFAPLAVSAQHIREGEKFGIGALLAKIQDDCRNGIFVTNYQKIGHFDLSAFGGVVLDESSILKSTDGHYRTRLIDECAQIPFRLAATATPAPNDFMELGNHAEFLGVMSYTVMLATFFVHDGGDTQKWRLKGHAENDFWKWMASWAVMIRKPSDLGYEDGSFTLPELCIHQHTIDSGAKMDGFLFAVEALTLQERQQARKQTTPMRVAECAELVNNTEGPFLVWCNLNDESAALKSAIPDAIEVKGSDTQEQKEERLMGFSEGKYRVLVTKPSIAGFGMNWQHCHNMIFVGLSDSWEQYYQAIRRCWRFGQTQTVNVYVVTADIEGMVVENIKRKDDQSDRMMDEMASIAKDFFNDYSKASNALRAYKPQMAAPLPKFI